MKLIPISFSSSFRLFVGSLLLAAIAPAVGQVSPAEVHNPSAKAAEQKYLVQLASLQRAIGATDFPFTFRLARYLDAKPGQRAALDSNGIEFIYFQDRVVLKVSGIYRVAFDSIQLSQNARASQTLHDAVLPLLRQVIEQVPRSTDYDAIGFEILYNARDANRGYEYEGQEVLAVVFSRDDAFALADATTDAGRQEILDRSDVFVNGKEFALAIGQRDPLNVQALERPVARPDVDRVSLKPLKSARSAAAIAVASPDVAEEQELDSAQPSSPESDAARVQEKLQAEVNATRNVSGATLRGEANAPSLETEGAQKLLHFTLQNTLSFERSESSIYKRAAQSFDLFLAPELKVISKKLPADAAVDALQFSVLNRLGAEKNETIDYICPMDSMRSFVENKITTQDLIDKSTVLVNGVRIGLDLQRVE